MVADPGTARFRHYCRLVGTVGLFSFVFVAEGHEETKQDLIGRYGPDSQAFKRQYEKHVRTSGSVCAELASAYAAGYLGRPNPTKAREYYARGARLNNRLCWEKLSEYCHRGLGGPRNDVEAYYWISLDTVCTDPRSFGGKEDWAAREEIATHLSSGVLERQWQRIDSFMAQALAGKIKVESPPFLSGLIDPKLAAEGRRAAEQCEREHRAKLRGRFPASHRTQRSPQLFH